MELLEAMEKRHTVRKFTDKPLDRETILKLEDLIDELNHRFHLSMELLANQEKILPLYIRKLLSKNAASCIILAGRQRKGMEADLGYASSVLMLEAQCMGLNTWWIGGTYSKKMIRDLAHISSQDKMLGILVVGYGENQGKPHKSKKPVDVAAYQGQWPDWFSKGVDALLLAPTAVNRQGFKVEGRGSRVKITAKSGDMDQVDLGIGKHHFELGAGRENFAWDEEE